MPITYELDVSAKRNTFVADVRFMHGDADVYTNEAIELGPTEDCAYEFVRLVTWLNSKREYYRLGSHDWNRANEIYEEILTNESFVKFFTSSRREEYDQYVTSGDEIYQGYTWEEYINDGERYWPGDVLSNHNYEAALESYQIYWYNGEGNRYVVKVVPDV